jgi:AcrR family transcriptional regulator
MSVAPAPVTPSTEKGEETRDRLIDLACAAFAEDGYARTSLNAVIRSSGLTKGAFYYYFPSKVSLALAVCEREKLFLQERVMARALESGDRAIDSLTGIVDGLLEVRRERPMARAVQKVCLELGREPELAALFPTLHEPWVELVSTLLRRAQDEGDVPDHLPVEASAVVIVCAFRGIESFLDGKSDDEIARCFEDYKQFVLRSVCCSTLTP